MWYCLPLPLAIPCGLLPGICLGLFNGLASMGTVTIFQGISYIVSKQSVILNLPPAFKITGQWYVLGFIPFSVVLMFIVVAIAGLILNFTCLGRYIYAIGGNEEAAEIN